MIYKNEVLSMITNLMQSTMSRIQQSRFMCWKLRSKASIPSF